MGEFDVIVVGSGCGGAPAAGNLASAGAHVCVLERGTWWGASGGNQPFPRGYLEFARSFRGLGVSLPFFKKYFHVNERGLFEIYFVNGYTIVIPCGVGGGSLVIGGFVDKPPDDIYDHYPKEITPEEMEKHFQSVAEVVEPRVAPKTTWYEQSVEAACERLDGISAVPQLTSMWYGDGPDRRQVRTNDFGRVQQNCQYRGDCLTGCNVGAKNSLDITYLRLVMESGGQIRDLCDVEKIRRANGGYEVDYMDLKEHRSKTARAPRVILSAGALNTCKILFRSRDNRVDGLPNLSETLGWRWGFNGDRIGLRLTPHNRLDHTYGTCLFRYMEVGSREHQFDHHFFACRSSVLAWPPFPLNALTNRVMAFLSLSREEPVGRLSPAGDVVDIYYPSQECHRKATICQRLVTMETDAVARPLSESARRRKIRRIDRTGKWKGIGSVHPTGGAAMADNPSDGVVDHKGEVFNYPNLFVCDSSIFPIAPCCGPHFFIMAHSDRVSKLIIQSEN